MNLSKLSTLARGAAALTFALSLAACATSNNPPPADGSGVTEKPMAEGAHEAKAKADVCKDTTCSPGTSCVAKDGPDGKPMPVCK